MEVVNTHPDNPGTKSAGTFAVHVTGAIRGIRKPQITMQFYVLACSQPENLPAVLNVDIHTQTD